MLLMTGAAALAVGLRARSGDAYHAAAWRATGATFLAEGVSVTTQNAFGGAAMHAGGTSSLMKAYLAWLPVFNHSRTFMVTGALLALAWLALHRGAPGPRFWTGLVALLCLGTAVGAALGVREGSFTRTGHVTALAGWDLMELLVILPVLFLLLVKNRVDRLLWALLGAYAASLALGIFWFLVLGQIAPGWTPSNWSRVAVRDALYVGMAAAALFRWLAVRRGREVHGMLGPPPLRVSMIR
ncbi:hypothetical protein [Longimicrobium sp.]|uniref:hypothetical protein n=1 Tax=Longimicrobium sp. TaxID=2029185 RepID=UPI002D80847B|nr:hypothetical protein [Longimicrobium sp.]